MSISSYCTRKYISSTKLNSVVSSSYSPLLKSIDLVDPYYYDFSAKTILLYDPDHCYVRSSYELSTVADVNDHF